jgi:endoglucanase
MKKLLITFVLIMAVLFMVTGGNNLFAASYNYADALSKSILYYEASWCGSDAGNNRLNWRGACHTDDGSDINLDLTGGFHDAGDHVKFGAPQGYAASVLAWTLYEYKDILTSKGQYNYLYNTSKHFTDYFIKCHPNANTFYYQIGEGGEDHAYWGPPELQPLGRPTYFVANSSTPGSDMCGKAAAALALMYLNSQTSDPTYAAKCLTAAKTIYTLGKTYQGRGTGQSFYQSGPYYDELCWGAIWLYYATNDSQYLTDCDTFIKAHLGANGALNYHNNWTLCWDDVWAAVFIKLYQITGSQVYKDVVEYNLNFWMTGITTTPGGLKYLDSWGVLRYTAAECMLALLYADISGNMNYRDFAKSQIDYMLGSNPRNSSYVVGFGQNYPKFPHHRAASGRLEGPPADEKKTMPEKHILYGALVGGPTSSDAYTDDVEQYVYTEVAIDYNAGFVGAMAGMTKHFGDSQTAETIPVEPEVREFYVDASVMGESGTEIKIDTYIHNESIHPPHYDTGLSYRYFMDLSELYNKGYTVANVSISTYYNPNSATISAIKPWDEANRIYYVEISWAGKNIYGKSEFQLVLTSYSTGSLVSSNDYSRTGLTSTVAVTDYIPVYRNGVKIYGNEPPRNGVTATPTPVQTPTPVVTPTPVRTATPVITATPLRTATPVVTATPNVTATPTPIRTATPPPATPTPVPTVGSIKVQFYNQSTAATSNQIYTNIKLVNTGSSAIALSNVKIRYYYTIDGSKAQTFYCDYSPIGSSNVSGTFVTMSTAKTGADTYLEVGFSTGAGNLAAGGNVTIQGRFAKSDWSNYTQTDDYSFNSTATTYVDWAKTTGYVSGALQWGTEP